MLGKYVGDHACEIPTLKLVASRNKVAVNHFVHHHQSGDLSPFY